MPSYDGSADLEVFEAFVYQWDSWCRAKGIYGRYAVEILNYAVSNKAQKWYMRHVALDARNWTMDRVYAELWEYCSPVSFREDLRRKLMRSKQKRRPVKDFAQDIQNISVRFPDIDVYTRKRILWDGADAYIRLFWIEKGRSVERDTFDILLHYAKRAGLRELERLRSSREMRGEHIPSDDASCFFLRVGVGAFATAAAAAAAAAAIAARTFGFATQQLVDSQSLDAQALPQETSDGLAVPVALATTGLRLQRASSVVLDYMSATVPS
ncbi:hypothetical protein EXIGLDRAFT_768383 [Exidia glandulosa HHB12029]|uniref:Retrotransposon gag domain-containing protein n=1 Tax=Exidia glandulosa HHB12029 TaxID=1314781 RepID=A0A165I8J5_EXIGL|nr:hypothetical protein EXIGLDRAFT_768383 [Exidia glandulosa HHB12029]